MITIKNVSRYAFNYEYIVARFVDGDWWFYGAWNDAEDAYNVAMIEEGQVFHTNKINAEVWE